MENALITGGSRGIGRATAILFAKAGADVAITYQRQDEAAAAEVKEEVERLGRKLPGRPSRHLEGSRGQAAVDEMVRESWGRIDILVNNAGIWTYLEIGSGDAAAWKETMEVNLDSVFLFHRRGRPSYEKAEAGLDHQRRLDGRDPGRSAATPITPPPRARSTPSPSPGPWSSPRTTSASTASRRAGWTPTCAPRSSATPAFRESVRQSIPLKRIPPPEDIAGPILFLASDLARHITGRDHQRQRRLRALRVALGGVFRKTRVFPSVPLEGESCAFPLPTFASLSASPSRALLRDQGGHPPWNPPALLRKSENSLQSRNRARSPQTLFRNAGLV